MPRLAHPRRLSHPPPPKGRHSLVGLGRAGSVRSDLKSTLTQSRFGAADDIDDRLRPRMGLDELVGLRQPAITEWLTIASDDLDALLLQRLNRLLFRLKPTDSGVACRFRCRSQEVIAQ